MAHRQDKTAVRAVSGFVAWMGGSRPAMAGHWSSSFYRALDSIDNDMQWDVLHEGRARAQKESLVWVLVGKMIREGGGCL